jgi:hypothetical protein
MMQVSLFTGLQRIRSFFLKNMQVQDEKIIELCNFAHPHRVLPGNNDPNSLLFALLLA